MARKIEITDYNPEWENRFKTEAEVIKNILGKNCIVVHHIGSTSVKGLRAKPIIDIMPVVKNITLVNAHNAAFEALGYECKGEYALLKVKLAEKFIYDSVGYCDGKDAFMKELEQKAIEWEKQRGL